MPFTTPIQFFVLFLALASGWLFGFASHPTNRKWKQMLRVEKLQNARNRALLERERTVSARKISQLEDALAGRHSEATEQPVIAETTAEPDAVAEASDAQAAPLAAQADLPTPGEPANDAHEAAASDLPAEAASAEAEKIWLIDDARDAIGQMPAALETAPADISQEDEEQPAYASAIGQRTAQAVARPAALPAGLPAYRSLSAALASARGGERPKAANSDAPATAPPAPRVAEDAPAPLPMRGDGGAPAAESMPELIRRNWFSWGGRDDLTRIHGIDGALQTRLKDLGVKAFADIEKLSAEDELALELRTGVPAGYIARERWREQAALLRAGNDDEFQRLFGATGSA